MRFPFFDVHNIHLTHLAAITMVIVTKLKVHAGVPRDSDSVCVL